MVSWTDEVKGKLGFGCMRLPQTGGGVDHELFSQMVDVYLEAGFNYFDTAHVYHGGNSETALRKCLTSRYPRDRYFIADKLSTQNFTCEDQIDDVLEEELEALGVEYMDMLLMHAQNRAHYDKYRKLHAYEHALAFKDAGKTRYFGISFHDSPELLEEILTDYPQIDAVQLQFNYADFENPSIQSRACYDVCEKHGIPVIAMEPVKGGNLVDLPEEAQIVVDSLPNPENLTNAGFALRFVASFPNIAVVLSGMSDMEQVLDNISSMKDPRPLEEEQIKGLLRIHDIIKQLGMIECTACHYCTGGCPEHIMIPEMLGALNTKRVFGGWNPGWYYNNTLTGDGHGKASDCVECGLCEKACPQLLPIRDLLKDVAKEFE